MEPRSFKGKHVHDTLLVMLSYEDQLSKTHSNNNQAMSFYCMNCGCDGRYAFLDIREQACRSSTTVQVSF